CQRTPQYPAVHIGYTEDLLERLQGFSGAVTRRTWRRLFRSPYCPHSPHARCGITLASQAGFGQSTSVTAEAFHAERRCRVLVRETARWGTAAIAPSSGARPGHRRRAAGLEIDGLGIRSHAGSEPVGSTSPTGGRLPRRDYGPGRLPCVRRIRRIIQGTAGRTPGSAAAPAPPHRSTPARGRADRRGSGVRPRRDWGSRTAPAA